MCVLRASGADFDPVLFLRASSLKACAVWRRGEPRLPKTRPDGARHEQSGMNVEVSEAPWSDLPAQVADAERFLREHRDEIERLADAPGLTDLILDFPVEFRIDGERIVAQFERFPASLVRFAGALRVGLELSIYPPGCEE